MGAGWDLPHVVLTAEVTIPYPGVNGVRFAAQAGYVYYTGCAQQLFARVAVDPDTLNPVGAPEIIQEGILSADDLCLDETTGVAYIAAHVDNTIHRSPLTPVDAPKRDVVVGEPFDDKLVGPTSLYWARGETDGRRVAYITTEGGLIAPGPDNIVHPAAVLRLTIVDAVAASH